MPHSRKSIEQRAHLSVVMDRLDVEGLSRAHVITTFFLSGIGAGHRMRLYNDRLPDAAKRSSAKALVDSLGLRRDDPFCLGWCYGWDLDLGKAEP
jgi:hypothetical protein